MAAGFPPKIFQAEGLTRWDASPDLHLDLILVCSLLDVGLPEKSRCLWRSVPWALAVLCSPASSCRTRLLRWLVEQVAVLKADSLPSYSRVQEWCSMSWRVLWARCVASHSPRSRRGRLPLHINISCFSDTLISPLTWMRSLGSQLWYSSVRWHGLVFILHTWTGVSCLL